jgi:hypothetical protein
MVWLWVDMLNPTVFVSMSSYFLESYRMLMMRYMVKL